MQIAKNSHYTFSIFQQESLAIRLFVVHLVNVRLNCKQRIQITDSLNDLHRWRMSSIKKRGKRSISVNSVATLLRVNVSAEVSFRECSFFREDSFLAERM